METVLEKTITGNIQAEYIEVEPNVRLHITDAGKGRPIVLIPGWPLSDEMFEYQYNDLINNNFRVIGITLRGFGKSDKPYGHYNYNVHVLDIKRILGKLDIKDAVLGGFSMGGAIAIRYASADDGAHVSKLALFGAAAPIWTQRNDFPFNLPKNAVDELIELNYKDRPKLLSNFAKIFSATETSLNEGIRQLVKRNLPKCFFLCYRSMPGSFTRYRPEKGPGENINSNINYAWQKGQNMFF